MADGTGEFEEVMKFEDYGFRTEITDGCDRLVVDKSNRSDWTTIEIFHTGSGERIGSLTLRSEKAAMDLEYALRLLLRDNG